MDKDEIEEALYATCGTSVVRGSNELSQYNAERRANQAVQIFRRQLLEFLNEIDAGLSVSELRELLDE